MSFSASPYAVTFAAYNSMEISCKHCGTPCEENHPVSKENHFCCDGCQLVYELLDENGLCSYYDLDQNPGIRIKHVARKDKYAFLDLADIESQLLDFKEGSRAKINFYIPSIHCSSCIWLLEKLYRLKDGVISSQVNFVKKELSVLYRSDEISLRELVELLDSIGYAPEINLAGSADKKKVDRGIIYKLGVAGFVFGNIMLLSFPEYLADEFELEQEYIRFFSWLNLFLSLPVLLYSAQDYFISAFKGLRYKIVNIDVPISLGIVSIFLRSAYEIIWDVGPGYLDSMAGLVFFLLIGKWYQDKTYKALSFERDFRSYFPISATLLQGDREVPVSVNELKKGDCILIRNEELIPADCKLLSKSANIDYSFVTGEALPVLKKEGDQLFAGGRQKGSSIRVEVESSVSQSYLTRLWNQDFHQKAGHYKMKSYIDTVSQYFTIAIISIATASLIYWLIFDPQIAIIAFTSVLIIACPCALALTLPFTYGSIIRIFGRRGFYLRSPEVIETLSKVNHLIFDKTGTLTKSNLHHLGFSGTLKSSEELLVRSLAKNSTHPMSMQIAVGLNGQALSVEAYAEHQGLGIEGIINGRRLKLGSSVFVGTENNTEKSGVHLSIDEAYKGFYELKNEYRTGIKALFKSLSSRYNLSILSGDNDSEAQKLMSLSDAKARLNFNQSPYDKRAYIEKHKEKGEIVLMAGDGLNDAAALKTADVGIAVVDDIYSFSPSSDGIITGESFKELPKFLALSRASKSILRWSFVISFLYNIVGLSFAVQGLLSPIIAAILMPLSSVSIVAFVSLYSEIKASRVFSKV